MADKSVSGECSAHGEFFGTECPGCEDGLECDRDSIVRIDLTYPEPSDSEKEVPRAVHGLRSQVRVPLRSMQPESDDPVINAYIEWSDQGISIRFDGYGEHTSEDGQGWPIHIEMHEGEPRVYVWGDINEEMPTTIASLTDAKESLREED